MGLVLAIQQHFGAMVHIVQKSYCENIHKARERVDLGLFRGEKRECQKRDRKDQVEIVETNFRTKWLFFLFPQQWE